MLSSVLLEGKRDDNRCWTVCQRTRNSAHSSTWRAGNLAVELGRGQATAPNAAPPGRAGWWRRKEAIVRGLVSKLRSGGASPPVAWARDPVRSKNTAIRL